MFCPEDKIKSYWEFLRGTDLPAWDRLSSAMRVAIIKMWAAGEKHAMDMARRELNIDDGEIGAGLMARDPDMSDYEPPSR